MTAQDLSRQHRVEVHRCQAAGPKQARQSPGWYNWTHVDWECSRVPGPHCRREQGCSSNSSPTTSFTWSNTSQQCAGPSHCSSSNRRLRHTEEMSCTAPASGNSGAINGLS